MDTIKRIALLVITAYISAVLLLSITGNHLELSPRNLSAWSGSAFFINGNGYLATANHVVKGGKKFQIYYKHQFYPAYVVATDPDHDVAIVKTTITPTTFLPLSNKDYQGEAIGVFGYPGGTLVLTLTTGTATYGGLYQQNVYAHARSCHGNSGGPIISSHGTVVGQLNWGYTGMLNNLCTSEGGGPTIKYIIDLAARNNIQVAVVDDTTTYGFDSIYYTYKDSVVYIEGTDGL